MFHKAAPNGIMLFPDFVRYTENVVKIFGTKVPSPKSQPEMYLQLFRGFDRDRDGRITFEELLIYHSAPFGSLADHFEVIFSILDENGDVSLTIEELTGAIANFARWHCFLSPNLAGDHAKAYLDMLLPRIPFSESGQITKDKLFDIVEADPVVLKGLKEITLQMTCADSHAA